MYLIENEKKQTKEEHRSMCRFAAQLHKSTAKNLWKHDKIPEVVLNQFREL